MQYRCANCKAQFITTLAKGIPAAGHGGTCPTCGVKDGSRVDIGGVAKIMEFEVLFTVTPSKEKRQLITEPVNLK